MEKKSIAFYTFITLVVGACIGNVIFFVSFISGDTPFFVWLIAALICCCYGMVVFTLSERYSEPGGFYLFLRRSLAGRNGMLLGFFCGWGYVVSCIFMIAAVCHLFFQEELFIASAIILLSSVLLLVGGKFLQVAQILIGTVLLVYFSYMFCESGLHLEAGSKCLWPLTLFAYSGSLAITFFVPSFKIHQIKFKLSFCLGLLFLLIATYGALLVNFTSLITAIAIISMTIIFIRISTDVIHVMAEDGFFSKFLLSDKVVIVLIGIISLLLSLFCTDSSFFLMAASMNFLSMASVPVSLFFLRCDSKILKMLAVISIIVFFAAFLYTVCFEIYLDNWMVASDIILVYLIGLIFYISCRKNTLRRFSGIVVHGKGRGRIFDIPTANMELFEGQGMPDFGVWQVKVFLRGRIYDGITNVGLRPTDDASQTPTIETMILEFSESIYGERMTIELVRFIRETKQFTSMEELRNQIQEDLSSCI